MHKISAVLLSLAGLLGFSDSVFAHTGLLPTDGFVDGFLHPFLGLDHSLVMLGVGLWAATQRLAVAGQIFALFLLYMLFGALFGLHGAKLVYVETAILLSMQLICGLLIFKKLQLPTAIAAALIAITAIMHGLAHGSEIPATASAYSYLFGMLIATGLLHVLGLTLGVWLNRDNTSWMLRLYGATAGSIGVWLLFN